MPKSDVRDVFARVSVEFLRLQPFFEGLTKENGVKVLCYEHEKDEKISRTHVHFILLGGQVTVPTLKNRIRNCIGTSVESTDWSFKTFNVEDQDNCIRYMSKGKLDPKMNIGFDEEYVMKMKNDGYDKKDEKMKKMKDDKDNKMSDWYYVSRALEIIFRNKYPDKTVPECWGVNEPYDFPITIGETVDALRQVIRQERKVIGAKKFMDYMFFIQMAINSSWKSSITHDNIIASFDRQATRYF